MKKICFLLILLVSFKITSAQKKFDALTFTPQMPKAGQTVNFKFDSRLSPLIAEKKVDILVYLFNKKNNTKVLEPNILQSGTVYSGSFKLDSNTTCIAFGFSAKDGKEKDNNAGDGYIVPVYNKNNQPVIEYYKWAGNMYSGYGERLFGMKTITDKNLAILEEGLKLNPRAMDDPDYFSAYLFAVNTAKKKDGEELAILSILKNLANKPDIKETDYATLTQWYNRLKMKSTSDSFLAIYKQKYPDGAWKRTEMFNAINKAKAADEKRAAFEAYIKNYPPTEAEKSTINFFKSAIASAYHKEKNYDAFKTWIKDLPIADKAGFYNDLSWNMALAKENINQAKAMSFEATSWAKKEMANPTEKKPDYETKKDW
ncbi:MAG: hypothetical protein WAT20_07420, partial [Ferruginibacter sp.]